MSKKIEINLKEIGRRLKETRNTLGITLKEMQKMCGVMASTISEMESGLKKPHHLYLYLLAVKFNVNINWIFTGKGTKILDYEIKMDFGEDNERIKDMIQLLEKNPFLRYEILGCYLKFKEGKKD